MQLGPSPDVLENVVPMMAGVERAFDRYGMCVVPTMDAETGMTRFVVSSRYHTQWCWCVGWHGRRTSVDAARLPLLLRHRQLQTSTKAAASLCDCRCHVVDAMC